MSEVYSGRRVRSLERAVLHGLPIGRSLRPCGTPARIEQHRRRGETCGLCRFISERHRVEALWKSKEHQAEAAAMRPILQRESQRRYASKANVKLAKLEWQRVNADRTAAANRRYIERLRERDPERLRETRRLRKMVRRARLKGVACEPIDRRVVWSRDDGRCHLCGLPADPSLWHLDHVVPIARGGAHLYDNVRVSHPQCNQSKGAKVA